MDNCPKCNCLDDAMGEKNVCLCKCHRIEKPTLSKPVSVKSSGKRKCPKCKRNLIKIRVRGASLFFIPKSYKGTLKYWKCRVCEYRETEKKGKPLVLTRPGGMIAV